MNMLIKNIKKQKVRRHCGLDPQSPEKKGMLKQVQHDVRVFILAAVIGFGFSSCGDWLDVVPDGVGTIDMAFNSRDQAIRYLGTCYYHLPKDGNPNLNQAMLGSDELWTVQTGFGVAWGFSYAANNILIGMQNAVNPILGWWSGTYQAIRDCNTFLDNVGRVPDLPEWEREQWIAEVKVLKAYYHFCLVKMYGPVPIIRESFPVDVDITSVQVERAPVDECFDYIVQLIDEAVNNDALPLDVFDPNRELGRITKPIALAIKAKVLVTAASPLFNCNNDQATLKNHDGTPLFSQDKEKELEKWQKAMVACREAIETCDEANIMLYKFPNEGDRYTDTIALDLSLRNAFSQRWNSDVIWANTQSHVNAGGRELIFATMPKLNPEWVNSNVVCKFFGAPLKMATLFYTRNGVPLDEDNTRNMNDIFNLRTAQAEDRLYIREGRTTIDLHFDREPRFYAWLGFDGAIWFGAGRNDDQDPSTLWHLGFKIGETDGIDGQGYWTGYLPKKYIPVDAQLVANNTISAISYPWPIMRLSDLYLLYAEAINEVEGPRGPNSARMFFYIDEVRKRAGLEGVKHSWDMYADNPKYDNQTGMRQIIQQERMIELSFEGHRFWDIRRWKIAPLVYRTPLQGWYMDVSIGDGTDTEQNEIMYTQQLLHVPIFGIKDYFWPIRNSDIDVNPNLVQNIGW